jgi:hypothetical protein
MNQLMLTEVVRGDDPLLDFQIDLMNVQVEIWQLEAERCRLGTLLRIRRAVRAQLARRYRRTVRQAAS